MQVVAHTLKRKGYAHSQSFRPALLALIEG